MVEAALFVRIVANGHAGRSRNGCRRNEFSRIVEELVDPGRLEVLEGGILFRAGGVS